MKSVEAFFVFSEKSMVPNGCQGGVGIVFGSYPGAASYVVQYHDSNVETPSHIVGAPVVLNALVSAQSPNGYHLYTNEGTHVNPDPVIPSGAHFFGVSGWSGSGSCGTVTVDDHQGGRFSDPKAWAVLPAGYTAPTPTPATTPANTTTSTTSSPGPPAGPIVATVTQILRSGTAPAVAYVQRSGKGPLVPLKVGGSVRVGDIVGTANGTILALQLVVGGLAAVTSGSEVAIADDGRVTGPRPTLASLWWIVSQRDPSVEIQTSGGVVGIKG